MSTEHPEDLPVSGYAIAAIYSTRQELTPVRPDGLPDEQKISVGWDWKWRAKRVFEVRVLITVEPWKSRSHRISSDVVGRFHQVDDSPNVKLEDFVSLQAVAMLLPYVRQYLSSLTSNTLLGSYYLPSLNVSEIKKGFNLAAATGARQNSSELVRPSAHSSLGARKKR